MLSGLVQWTTGVNVQLSWKNEGGSKKGAIVLPICSDSTLCQRSRSRAATMLPAYLREAQHVKAGCHGERDIKQGKEGIYNEGCFLLDVEVPGTCLPLP